MACEKYYMQEYIKSRKCKEAILIEKNEVDFVEGIFKLDDFVKVLLFKG